MKRTCDRCKRYFTIPKIFKDVPHACPYCGRNLGTAPRVTPTPKPCGCGKK